MVEKLSAEATKAALWELAGWTELAGREAIAKTFVFKDFNEAFGFMALLGLLDRRNHRGWVNMTLDRYDVTPVADSAGYDLQPSDVVWGKAQYPRAWAP